MKKKIFGGIAIVAIAVAVALNVSLVNNKADKASLLALANVEALAGDEYKSGFWGTNWKDYTVKCTVTNKGTGIIHLGPLGSFGYESGKETTAEFDGTRCGYGTGYCVSSDC